MIAKTKNIKPVTSKKMHDSRTSKESLEDIFENLLKDIFWAEKHLVKALPKIAKATYNELLTEAFEAHLDETQMQVQRLENCFELADIRPVGKRCEAMEGLVKEAMSAVEDYESGHARDAALIAAAQKIEHYEISAYGTLRTMATVLGKVQCATLLEESKDEEAEADMKLTELAEKINQMAATMEEEEVD